MPLNPASNRPDSGAAQVWRHRMYLLALLPMLSGVIETGRWPTAPREWVTELLVGALIATLVRKVRTEHGALLAAARTDSLTGLGNRRAFEEALQGECVRAQRLFQPLSLVCIDLDHFKLINDRTGHDGGDRVLQQLAEAIRQVARAHFDRGFRLGGDEFALLLPGSAIAQADAVVARLRAHCARSDAVWRDGPLGLSAGMVEFEAGEAPGDLLRRADEAMYRAKQARRTSVAWP